MSIPMSSAELQNHSPHGINRPDAARKPASEKSLTDDFMKIFLQQMKSQNPMKPNDSSVMMQQMGQLTSLQATQELRGTVKMLTANVAKAQLVSSTQLVGRKVHILSNLSPLPQTGNLMGSIFVPDEAKDVTITIKDASGQIVKTIKKGDSGAGNLDFDWDGIGPDGKTRGTENYYHISASANIGGKNTELATSGAFAVNSVALNRQDGSTIVNVEILGGRDIGDVVKIS